MITTARLSQTVQSNWFILFATVIAQAVFTSIKLKTPRLKKVMNNLIYGLSRTLAFL